MKHIETIETRDLAKSAVTGGCGEARLPVSPHARHPAAWQIRLAKTMKNSMGA